ncbi:MAG: hypothetical protein JNM74_24245 [Myxococcales bacterium]|nr:hypothetical protein [Myxococcales bacterium]
MKDLRLTIALGTLALLLGCTSNEENVGRGCDVEPSSLVSEAVCGGVANGPIAVDGVATIVASSVATTKDVRVAITVDKPEILRVVETTALSDECRRATVRVRALAEGKATVRFVGADGTTVDLPVEVLPPRRLEVSPYLAALASQVDLPTEGDRKPEAPGKTTVLRQVEGGRATWQTKLFAADGRELRGRAGVTYTIPAGVTAEPVAETTDLELVELSASAKVAGELEARAGQASLVLPMQVVGPDAVAGIEIFSQADEPNPPSKTADKEQRFYVYVQAKDGEGAILHGAPFDLVLGGKPIGPGGELLTYAHTRSGGLRPLVATVKGSPARAEVSLRTAAEPAPSRSAGHELAGCSISGRGLSAGGWPLAVSAVVLSWLRRRRRRAA